MKRDRRVDFYKRTRNKKGLKRKRETAASSVLSLSGRIERRSVKRDKSEKTASMKTLNKKEQLSFGSLSGLK